MRLLDRRSFLQVSAAAGLPAVIRGQNSVETPAPVHLTSAEDHQRLLDLLHIQSLRRGADGTHPDAPNAANYDESKAGPFSALPDSLVLENGKHVKSARTWWKKRRPEIVELFDREIYGRTPARTPAVRWQVIKEMRESNGHVPVITRQLAGRVDDAAYPPVSVNLELTLTTPTEVKAPVPVIMELMFVWPPNRPRPQGVPAGPPAWHADALARGWAHASIVPVSIQPDNGAGLTEGIIGLVNRGRPRKLDDWGALKAWAWGASRALDYFETNPAIDARKVGIAGHSRYGKASLVAMAHDARFAIAYISSSGEGGAKLYRRNFGEMLENVAAVSEYHWMAGNFLKYAGPLTANDLPVDVHELIALCAPRPVFIGAGATKGDGWADAKGMFLAAAAAGPVYKLLGKRGLGTSEFPPIGTALVDGDLAFRQHSEGHTPAPNWPVFLKFAERYF